MKLWMRDTNSRGEHLDKITQREKSWWFLNGIVSWKKNKTCNNMYMFLFSGVHAIKRARVELVMIHEGIADLQRQTVAE